MRVEVGCRDQYLRKIRDMRCLGINKARVALIVILLGMMADAIEECLSLTRFMDKAFCKWRVCDSQCR